MSVSPKRRFAILRRDDFRCRYCGRRAPNVELHVDHVVAKSRGGKDDRANLVTACVDCNLGKGAEDGRDLEQLVEQCVAHEQMALDVFVESFARNSTEGETLEGYLLWMGDDLFDMEVTPGIAGGAA